MKNETDGNMNRVLLEEQNKKELDKMYMNKHLQKGNMQDLSPKQGKCEWTDKKSNSNQWYHGKSAFQTKQSFVLLLFDFSECNTPQPGQFLQRILAFLVLLLNRSSLCYLQVLLLFPLKDQTGCV